MPRQLTELTIRSLAHPKQGSTKHMDPSLPGFGVRCTARSKSFFVMYGSTRRLKTLGRWPDLSLREARKQAKVVLATFQPRNPSEANYAALRAIYLQDCKLRLRPSTLERYTICLNQHENWPKDVEDPNTIKALKAMGNWCLDRDLITRNPYARRKAIFTKRDRVLTDDEIKAIWHYNHPPYSDIIKLLILTGQRRNQIAHLSLEWLDDETITFPSSIMKSKRTHIIPLTAWHKQYLHLPLSFHGWSKAKQRIDKHTGVSNWRLHDIRRYFSTTMAKLGTPLHVTEQILDHRSTVSGVQAIYLRYNFLPEMKTALTHYEQHLESLLA